MVEVYDVFIIVIVVAYLGLAPFTKVEESFSIQAIHDILNYGINDLSKYDHIEFPGAVPRSFIGPLIISGISEPILSYLPISPSKLDGQFIARGVLGIINVFGLMGLKNALLKVIQRQSKDDKKNEEKDNGNYLGIWYALFQITQFHLNFYASRTLPNFFALPFTNFAFGQIIKGDYLTAISVLAFTSVVFRVEIVVLTLTTGLFIYLNKKVTIPQLIKAGLIGGSVGAISSLVVDSYFWGRITIPELESFVFNVIEGKSSEWGTSPFHYYFTRTLPFVFITLSVPILAIIGSIKDITKNNSLRILGSSSLLFITLLSFQPHKEWRFIVYVFPVINLIGSNGASYITFKASKSFFYKLLVLGIFLSSIFALLVSFVWAQISSFNYPGGVAMNTFHQEVLIKSLRDLTADQATVHFDVATAMSGVTRFNELTELSGVAITYDKTEDPERLATLWDSFDYLICEVDLSIDKTGETIPNSSEYSWKLLDTIEIFQGINTRAFQKLDPVKFFQDLLVVKSKEPFSAIISPFLTFRKYLFVYEKVKTIK